MMQRLVFLIILLLPLAISSADENDKTADDCKSFLQVIGSGRNSDVMPELTEAAKVLTNVARLLGMATPNHTISFVPSIQMNLLASLGRHSAPHWHDGEQILRSQKSAGNILEFVTKGCERCRSYFSDVNPPKAQLSIIMHVLGHNDVSAHSNYMQVAKYDPISASAAFARKVQQLYEQYDHDEVSLFVQWLYSLEDMQDLADGTFSPPEAFHSNTQELNPIIHSGQKDGKNPYEQVKHPRQRTPNILQTLVQNLPSHAPAWKRELIELFENTRRYYSGNIATKIMNEGWATMAQYLIARHSPYVTDHDLIEYGVLLKGVTFPSLQNPYYLGLEAWMHLWDKFKERNVVRHLSALEQDQKFITYAHELIRSQDDYGFLQISLDQDWVNKQKLFLYRPAIEDDIRDPRKVPPRPPNADALYVALSRDHTRVVRYILRKVAAKHLMFPKVYLVDFNWQSQGMVLFEHEPQEGVSLEKNSAIKTLFVLSQILERPTALRLASGKDSGLVFIVNPRGHLSILSQIEGKLTENSGQASNYQPLLDEFKSDVRSIVNDEMARGRLDPIWQSTLAGFSDQRIAPVRKIMIHAPYADHAILEYFNVIKQKLINKLRQLVNSGQPPVVRGGKIQVPIFPEVPHFRLDEATRRAILRSKPPAPFDWSIGSPRTSDDVGFDDNSTLNSGPYLPGDLFWGVKTSGGKGKGKGEGQGDGEGEGEGEEKGDGQGDGEGEGDGYGTGGGSVAVPVEFWGKILGEQLKLTNIRRTKGKTEEMHRVRRGAVHRPEGYQLDERTLYNAIEKALALRKKKNKPHRIGFDVDRRTIIREAVPLMDRGDIVVASSMQIPRPDFEAVLVVMGDLTGSMGGERVEIAKQLIFNIQALLRANYKKITIRYVGFGDTAEEMEEKKFFTSFFGGGTSYVSGLVKGKEILDEYSNETHNKYMLLVGDAESGDQVESANIVRKLTPDLQFFSFAVTTGGGSSGWTDPFVQEFENIKSFWKWIGIAKLKSVQDVIPSLPILYPQED